jgi:hypothetical protein
MPIVMLLLGGLLGTLIGGALAAGMAALAGIHVYGPITSVLGALLALGPTGIPPVIVQPLVLLFGAGLALLVAFIFFYAAAAISVLTGAALGEFFSRGAIIGASSGANFVILSAIPFLAPFAGIIFVITLLALIPAIAGNRFYESLLGLLGWILPLNYLMLPLGLLAFLVTAPFAMASAAPGAGVRFDILTWTIEVSGGAALGLLSFSGGVNIGNFTFITRPFLATTFVTGLSAHETGHTLNGAAFGGFFYWIGAIDENVPPLGRGTAAYSELLADSHFGGATGGPFIPMW